jgi:hypothetical protein
MNDRLSRRHAHASTLLMSALLVACLVVSTGLVVVGCGSGSEADTTATTASGDATATTAATADVANMTGAELGEAIGATWAEAMQALNAALEGQPEASTVQAKLEDLKEQYIQKMVAYGKQRQTLDAAAQAEVDAATLASLNSAATAEWYKTYMDNYDHYSYASGDVEFTNILAAFNDLQVYADFELLKSQEPDEATRLGIQ